jgi:predicted small metal-binding protein
MGTAPTSPRKSIDCRQYPSEINCTLKISGTEDEVLQAAVAHAITVHKHPDTPDLVNELRALLKDERAEEVH